MANNDGHSRRREIEHRSLRDDSGAREPVSDAVSLPTDPALVVSNDNNEVDTSHARGWAADGDSEPAAFLQPVRQPHHDETTTPYIGRTAASSRRGASPRACSGASPDNRFRAAQGALPSLCNGKSPAWSMDRPMIHMKCSQHKSAVALGRSRNALAVSSITTCAAGCPHMMQC
jgi:hypothetical protein